MGKAKKPRNAARRAKKKKALAELEPANPTWVDNLDFIPLDDQEDEAVDKDEDHHDGECEDDHHTLSIISWNVLATSYCSRRSHCNLPQMYQSTVFNVSRRKALLRRCLQRLDSDIICLQEVDMDDVKNTLKEDYACVETPRSPKGGGIGSRVDSCGVYALREKWTVEDVELITLDDLAYLAAPGETPTKSNWNVQGIQQSFLRRNKAILVRLRHKMTKQTLVVANAHLFWHPGYEYVKVCQAHYVLTRAKSFCEEGETFILAGDFNSRPGGCTHTYLTRHGLNFRNVAPWYSQTSRDPFQNDNDHKDEEDLVDGMGNLTVDDSAEPLAPQAPRYILDVTLNKLCRWLRIMGIDTALETDEEERKRTANDKRERRMVLLERCRAEERTLVTTSTRLVQRTDCPSSAYNINSAGSRNLEVALVHMLLSHGVTLEPEKFLTRCVVCNGMIVEVKSHEESKTILRAHDAPESILYNSDGSVLEVFKCDGCNQPYWWCEIPTSSASRVKSTALRLLELCIRAGVPYQGGFGIFDEDLPIQKWKDEGWDFTQKDSDLLRQNLQIIDWLKCENVPAPIQLESAYAQKDASGCIMGESLPFTNVTDAFVDTLDYIFYNPHQLKLTHRWRVPTSFVELNFPGVAKGHLLPSNLWPSDHLAVGACFDMRALGNTEKATGDETKNPGGH